MTSGISSRHGRGAQPCHPTLEDDTGYVLPDVERRIHEVAADRHTDVAEGMLFRIPEMSATSFPTRKSG